MINRVKETVQEAIRTAYRPLLLLKGRNITQFSQERSCLVLAPHPDDETLGCGATIMRKRDAGTPVRVVIATDGRHSHSKSQIISTSQLAKIRQDEAVRACGVLGLDEDKIGFLEFEDLHLEENAEALMQRLKKLISEFEPDEILVPSIIDTHPDHRALSKAVRDMIETERLNCYVYEYPILFWTVWPWVTRSTNLTSGLWHFLWDPIVSLPRLHPERVRTDGYISRKREALQAYRSQMSNLTGEATWRTMDEKFLANFFQPYEIFFPLKRPNE